WGAELVGGVAWPRGGRNLRHGWRAQLAIRPPVGGLCRCRGQEPRQRGYEATQFWDSAHGGIHGPIRNTGPGPAAGPPALPARARTDEEAAELELRLLDERTVLDVGLVVVRGPGQEACRDEDGRDLVSHPDLCAARARGGRVVVGRAADGPPATAAA